MDHTRDKLRMMHGELINSLIMTLYTWYSIMSPLVLYLVRILIHMYETSFEIINTWFVVNCFIVSLILMWLVVCSCRIWLVVVIAFQYIYVLIVVITNLSPARLYDWFRRVGRRWLIFWSRPVHIYVSDEALACVKLVFYVFGSLRRDRSMWWLVCFCRLFEHLIVCFTFSLLMLIVYLDNASQF